MGKQGVAGNDHVSAGHTNTKKRERQALEEGVKGGKVIFS